MAPDRRNAILAFGPFRLFPFERRLEKEGTLVPLGARALDLLIVLVEHAGEVVPNRTLLASAWRKVNVEESSLRFQIKNLRKALGENRSAPRYVTNIPGRGYCFAAPVDRMENADAPQSRGAWFGAKANLPAARTALIGRSDSVEAIRRELSLRRIVTIAGPAGIGKTTLAIAAAQALRESFAGAALFVDLAPIEDASLVASTLASALGLVLRAEEPVSEIMRLLHDKRLLIVLDNSEQVIGAAAELAHRILMETAEIYMIVTSREPLRIAGECVHRLAPLECPPVKADITANEAGAYAAVQLFVDRAAASVGGFSLTDEQAPSVAEICRRLDGIPFAIELAAARVEFFGITALAGRLDNMFALLTQGRRFALPRHQTLRATLDWGYNLLSPVEQTVLRRIAIFRTKFSLDSALAVVCDSTVSTEEIVDAMAALVAKSLLSAESAGETPLYRLLEATRLYAAEKLMASDEGALTARRHAQHHLARIETALADRRPDPDTERPRLRDQEIDEVRAALDWSFAPTGDLAMGFGLLASSLRLWLRLSLTLEYVGRIERALLRLSELPEPDAIMEMRLQIAFGYAIWYSGSRRNRLEPAFARALELAQECGDARARLQALWGAWAVRRVRGQYREALAAAENYEVIAGAAGDPAAVVLADRILGLTHHYLGHQEIARLRLERVRPSREIGAVPDADFQLAAEVAAPALLARILWLQGFPDRATAALDQAIDAARRVDHWFSLYYTLCLAGFQLALWTGDLRRTRTYLYMTAASAAVDRWRACWALILRLREGSARDRLTAAFLEPRVDLSTSADIAELASQPVIPTPDPDENIGDALWSLPEILRVNAELLIARGEADAAEAQLLRSLDVARSQATLSWELRTATSLAKLWRRKGRLLEARDLLAKTYNRFDEGFETADMMTAARLLTRWA